MHRFQTQITFFVRGRKRWPSVMSGSIYKTAFTLLLLTHHVYALNILAIASFPLRSHYMAFRTLFHELAIRGHNVTVINNFPDKNPHPNLKFVDLQSVVKGTTPTLEVYETINDSYMHWYNILRHVTLTASNNKIDCETLFTSENAVAHRAQGHKYDVIFVEQFMGDCGLAYALALYDAPIIGISSHVLLPFAYPRFAIPFDASADAFYFSNAGPNPSLFQKVETTLVNLFFTTLGRWYFQSRIYEVFTRKLPHRTLDIEKEAKNRMKMMFSYQHFSVTGARPLAPQLLEIAGIHVGVPKTVPDEIEKFLADAHHGAIYVSFGSNLKANSMSEHKLQQFLTAFKRLPYKFIWKYENATFTDEKILTGSWFPQLDILCHPKVLAFVSHGGMLSISETTHCGKPILTVPFFGDQFSNSAAVRAVGLGRTLFFNLLNSENFEEAIKELTSPEMQENAQRISRLWHDRPQPVMDAAIYWTEYVARHKSAPPSLPAKSNTWFESLLIDVYIVILVIIMLVGSLVYAIFRFIKYIVMRIVSFFRKNKEKRE